MHVIHLVAARPIRIASLALGLACALIDPAFAKPAADATPATVTVESCAWDRPGHNPFMGDVVAAVDRYRDIPDAVRARLKVRMTRREYDDLVSIRRDSISGRAEYGTTISDMHFGTHQVCRSVTRAAWRPDMQERGLVYCEGRHCILVPTVCRNVSRISRAAVSPEHAQAPDEPDDLLAVVPPAAVPAAGPLGAAPPTPLALDDAPSFAVPLQYPGQVGESAGAVSGGLAGPPDLAPAPAPMVLAPSLPPLGAASPAPPVTTPVPEPQTWAMLLAGIAGLAAWRRCHAVRN